MTRLHESPATLHIGYHDTTAALALAEPGTLAVIAFGTGAPQGSPDPRHIRVGLDALHPTASILEVWRSAGTITSGSEGALRWSTDGAQTFFAIEVDEGRYGGVADATEHAYRSVTRFVAAGATPHVARLWNYLDAINLGSGDAERYREFCRGRARALDRAPAGAYPAATAIGRQDGVRTLQVYGLALASPGNPVENPRQVSAWQYPRQYGPIAPTFARGMLDGTRQLLISGTAAVVGHASRHQADIDAQIAETWMNLDTLFERAYGNAERIGSGTLLKGYVRDRNDVARVAAAVGARAPALRGLLLLAGDICRAELLVEIDGVHRTGR